MDIIPAIDIKNGKVVKALKGNRENYQAIAVLKVLLLTHLHTSKK